MVHGERDRVRERDAKSYKIRPKLELAYGGKIMNAWAAFAMMALAAATGVALAIWLPNDCRVNRIFIGGAMLVAGCPQPGGHR